MDKKLDLRKLAELIAIRYYNSERNILTAFLIKDFLISNNFKIQESINNFFLNEKNEITKEKIFLNSDFIIISGIDLENIFQYLLDRYIDYESAFFNHYKISLASTIFFSIEISKLMLNKIGFVEEHIYDNKKEYANRKHLAVPDKNLINLVYSSFIDIEELKKDLSQIVNNFNEGITKYAKINNLSLTTNANSKISMEYFYHYLNLFSFKQANLSEQIRFREFPFFIYENKLVLIEKDFFRYLPQKLHHLLAKTKSFSSKKGKGFEKIGLDLLELVDYSKLYRNIEYIDKLTNKNCEVDGILNLRRSTWFVECKSREINSLSLTGNHNKLNKDLKEGIFNAIKQAERAIENKNSPEINSHKIQNRTGIIIITEGIFPNESHLRLTELKQMGNIDISKIIVQNSSKYPLIILNYFELKKILTQPDKHLFEEFLIWRTQDKMPIFCADECDFWAFYCDNYRKIKEVKIAFESCKEKNIITQYISKRFNNKHYLQKIISKEKQNN